MPTVDLSNAKEVVQRFNANDATRYINAGWTLIETASGKDESGYPLVIYSLAWMAEGAPVTP